MRAQAYEYKLLLRLVGFLHCSVRLSQIQKMGLQPGDISMFSTLMDLVKEARELAEQNQ